MTKIANDINYSRELLAYYLRCKLCGYSLLMFGCDNLSCKNYWKNNIKVKNPCDPSCRCSGADN